MKATGKIIEENGTREETNAATRTEVTWDGIVYGISGREGVRFKKSQGFHALGGPE